MRLEYRCNRVVGADFALCPDNTHTHTLTPFKPVNFPFCRIALAASCTADRPAVLRCAKQLSSRTANRGGQYYTHAHDDDNRVLCVELPFLPKRSVLADSERSSLLHSTWWVAHRTTTTTNAVFSSITVEIITHKKCSSIS